MSEARAVLVVTVEVDAADEDEFNRWYDEEHIPEKLATPGFLSARRFKVADDSLRYLVIYELADPQAALSPEYMSQPATEWGQSMMARWKSWSRDVWVDLKST